MNRLADSLAYVGHPYGFAPTGHRVVASVDLARRAAQLPGDADGDVAHAARRGRQHRSAAPRAARAAHARRNCRAARTRGRRRARRRSRRARSSCATRQLPTNYLLGYYAGPSARDPGLSGAARRVRGAVRALLHRDPLAAKSVIRSRGAVSRARDRDGGVYVTTTDPNADAPVMRAEIDRLQRELIDAAGLERLTQQFITDYFLKNETNADQATFLARAQIYHGDYRAADHFVDDLRRVRPDDVRRVARQYMHDFRFVYLGKSRLAVARADRPVLSKSSATRRTPSRRCAGRARRDRADRRGAPRRRRGARAREIAHRANAAGDDHGNVARLGDVLEQRELGAAAMAIGGRESTREVRRAAGRSSRRRRRECRAAGFEPIRGSRRAVRARRSATIEQPRKELRTSTRASRVRRASAVPSTTRTAPASTRAARSDRRTPRRRMISTSSAPSRMISSTSSAFEPVPAIASASIRWIRRKPAMAQPERYRARSPSGDPRSPTVGRTAAGRTHAPWRSSTLGITIMPQSKRRHWRSPRARYPAHTLAPAGTQLRCADGLCE